MSKQPNQKLKLLYLKDYLERETDESHPTSVKRIIEYMESLGIPCERKTVYGDIDELRRYGLDIISTKGNKAGYFIGSRDFQGIELRLLIDTISTSQFITAKKTAELIDKLSTLASSHEKKWLKSRVYNVDKLKNNNETIYYVIFHIHRAISKEQRIAFKYWKYGSKKERIYKKEGGLYKAEPYLLTYDNGKYYLVARDIEDGVVKNFRVDKIDFVEECKEKIQNQLDENQLATYIREQFSMYGGETVNMTIRFNKDLVGVIIDKFGTDIHIGMDKQGACLIRVRVKASVWFYSWLTGLGREAEIVSPISEREKYIKYLEGIIGAYNISSGENQK